MQINRSWLANLSFLQEFSRNFVKLKPKLNPINFTMLIDSLVCFLHLICDDRLIPIANHCQNTTTNRIKTLSDFKIQIFNFWIISFQTCLNEELYEHLFTKYLKELEEVKEAISQIQKLKSKETADPIASLKSDIKWHRISYYAKILQLYLDLLFDEPINNNKEFKKNIAIKTEDELFQHLNLSHKIINKLEHYIDTIKKLKDGTLEQIQFGKNQILSWLKAKNLTISYEQPFISILDDYSNEHIVTFDFIDLSIGPSQLTHYCKLITLAEKFLTHVDKLEQSLQFSPADQDKSPELYKQKVIADRQQLQESLKEKSTFQEEGIKESKKEINSQKNVKFEFWHNNKTIKITDDSSKNNLLKKKDYSKP